MKRRFLALVLAGCLAAVLSTAAWADETPTAWDGSNLALTDGSYYLDKDVTISGTLTIEGTVTLDLNGWVLQRVNTSEKGSVIHVKSGTLTLVDNNTSAEHKFTDDNGLWKLDDNGDKVVKGGVITGGTGSTYKYNNDIGQIVYNDCGGGVFVAPGASFIMEGGNIVGCSAGKSGGGVKVTNDRVFCEGGFSNTSNINDGQLICGRMKPTHTEGGTPLLYMNKRL